MVEIEDVEKKMESENVRRVILSRILSKEANERLKRLKLVKPDIATQLEVYLIRLYQLGQIKGIISDEQMKKILSQISEKREFRIRR